MPRDEREPQSYGSDEDWVTGRTGQQVNDPKSSPAPEHREFYDDRRDSERSAPDQGGRPTEGDAPILDHPTAHSADAPSGQKVTVRESGAKRNSYFRKRDYE
jgi:hypothetical protein